MLKLLDIRHRCFLRFVGAQESLLEAERSTTWFPSVTISRAVRQPGGGQPPPERQSTKKLEIRYWFCRCVCRCVCVFLAKIVSFCVLVSVVVCGSMCAE